jgi:hypothetical protein
MLHVDVKKLGNIPGGGGWRVVGRPQGKKNRIATPDTLGSKYYAWGNKPPITRVTNLSGQCS